jgi:uncharacterized damage-inducible protein DinB
MDPLRRHLLDLLTWDKAHITLDEALAGLPASDRGLRPDGLPYSVWQLLEHIRRAQRDILDFCTDPDYEAPDWPADYWPESAAPPSATAWDDAVAAVLEDRDALLALVADDELDLLAEIPHGEGQTYLREILLVADHTAYHVGQLLVVRRALGAWE